MKRKLLLVLAIYCFTLIVGCTGGGGVGSESGEGSILLNIQSGWEAIDAGDYDSAIEKFNSALSLQPEKVQEVEAITGLAWGYARKGQIEDSVTQFEKVKNLNNDANVGYVGALFARGKEGDYGLALQLLDHIDKYGGGLDHYVSPRTGVSNAEAHALYAYCYFLTGNETKSKEHIIRAKELDPNSESVDDIQSALELLGLKIT